ncbi:hypothetical protein TWF730_000433 [Orbilia blumenaviensis]|uniref:Uncharacterized protein n=1 Tax=Orbilia blumenaviensis TaxID=1796055 RepID=A0AAV9VNN6_9PEZI
MYLLLQAALFLSFSSLVNVATAQELGASQPKFLYENFVSNHINVTDLKLPVRTGESTATKIFFLRNSTAYCLTDPGITLQPRTNRTNQIFATIEKCTKDFDPFQLWTTSGNFTTKIRKSWGEPQLPFYGPDITTYDALWVKNVATWRCIQGFSEYPREEMTVEGGVLPDERDYFGFVFLSESCEEGEGYGVQSGLLRNSPPNEPLIPAPTNATFDEVIYFTSPSLTSNRPWQCPNDSSNPQNNRTKTLILPEIITLTTNNRSFHPALFGCTDTQTTTTTSLTTYLRSPLKIGLEAFSKDVDMVRNCMRENARKMKEHNGVVKRNAYDIDNGDYDDDDYNNEWELCRRKYWNVRGMDRCKQFLDREGGVTTPTHAPTAAPGPGPALVSKSEPVLKDCMSGARVFSFIV